MLTFAQPIKKALKRVSDEQELKRLVAFLGKIEQPRAN
jgi:hypothetical protein